ncbi:Aldehyde oxidase and xanthine dehydrogenase molybdopterin binding domain protein [Trichostrongylus colubriformis]|uniref:Aldehyde oxidase and xanthine dehydrogenase molybdopterin binding domain protein n=1 Tax=Trichostrongylus colubriformis TaxID=6319 RepID=A0AAN8FRC0_TRICO
MNRPLKIVLKRLEDMVITGKRHPAMVKYRVGTDKSGILRCSYLKVYLDGGYAIDTTRVVTYMSSALSDTCYKIPVMRAEGYALKTNKSNNTTMRGCMLQTFFAMNGILSHVAHAVNRPLEKVMEMNFNMSGGVRLSKQVIPKDALLECWNECLQWSKFEKVRNEVDCFNKTSKDMKRGIAMSAVRMGVNQTGSAESCSADALVQIFPNGSVVVKIGGIEMKQGEYTKYLQIASRALGIPVSLFTIIDSSTDMACDQSQSGGKGPDAYGQAIQACCEKLMVGLRQVLKEERDWGKAILKAQEMHIPLMTSMRSHTNGDQTGKPQQPASGSITGAACVVSQIDCRTGEQQILSVDIVMDVGRILDPAVDVGQIEGALMMSYGSFTCEELAYDNGKLFADTFSKYKLPSTSAAPRKIRVKLITERSSMKGYVQSPKDIGEPSLMLGVGIYASLRYAIAARRQDLGQTNFFGIAAPLTAAKILSYCNPH